MSTWTLLLDESGNFEGRERTVRIVGGVLAPGDGFALETAWREPFKALCRNLGASYPPHSTDLELEVRNTIRAKATQLLAERGGLWLFLVEPVKPETAQSEDLAAYARMLGETVDIAARVSGSEGATKLEVFPARRSPPLAERSLALAAQAGFDVVDDRLRMMVPGEVRQAFDALARDEAGLLPLHPSLSAVDTPIATYGGAHPGVVFADLGCNYLYGRIRDSADVSLEGLVPDFVDSTRALVLPRNALPRLRRLDRSLRRMPPSLTDAANEVALLRDQARGDATALSTVRAARDGAAAVAVEMWNARLAILAKLAPSRLAAIARTLAGQAEAQLAIKSGYYEGLWLALDDGWNGLSQLAERARSSLGDRELAARLWRLTLEAANHRGDVASATRALQAFDAVLASGISLALLAERLNVTNLAAVAEQNALPFRDGAEMVTPQSLELSARKLIDAADLAAALLDLERGVSPPTAPPEPDDRQRRFGEAISAEVCPNEADRERGRMYGTAARSLAFAGKLREARELALRARGFFRDTFDLSFNSVVLARIELEQCRLEPTHPTSLLRAALEDLDCFRLRNPTKAKDLLSVDPAARFLLDLLLRTMLWANQALDLPVTTWVTALTASDPNSLLALLSAGGQRSHPTELIARHAGELARRHGATDAGERWFQLSVNLSVESPEGTIRRFGEMTQALALDDRFAGSGPPGSVLNPTFEYR